jgi:hypothetical protein
MSTWLHVHGVLVAIVLLPTAAWYAFQTSQLRRFIAVFDQTAWARYQKAVAFEQAVGTLHLATGFGDERVCKSCRLDNEPQPWPCATWQAVEAYRRGPYGPANGIYHPWPIEQPLVWLPKLGSAGHE